MSRDWEAQFREWAKPPGKTEEERCNNAESSIRNAIHASSELQNRNIKVFTQGSYRNNTNVRRDSDVDIGILCTDSMFPNYPEGMTGEDFGNSPADYLYSQYKDDVEKALASYFGRSAVTRGNKAINVHETSYHVEADVAPFFEHRRYYSNGKYLSGVALLTDRRNNRVVNWPEQHYQNGVMKNNDTGRRYKSIVRVLKALSVDMTKNIVRDADIPGFLIECLVWNVPNDLFQHSTYTEDVKSCITFLYNTTKSQESCNDWREVSELKYLFRASQKWTREEANAFTLAVWRYADLGD